MCRTGFSISSLILFVYICSFASFSGADLSAQETVWPQFHGPNRDNISTETGLMKEWPDTGPKLLWKTGNLGCGYSSVSISSGMIFIAGDVVEDTVITALDMDGKIVWRTKNGKSWMGSYPGSRGTPTIDGDHLYHESPHGDVICLEAKTGKKIWSVNILEKFKGENIMWALSESLLIDKDRVICCPGGSQTCMVALNKNSGELVWQAASTEDKPGYCSPIVIEQGGLRIILSHTAKALIGVNADNGELLFREDFAPYADENVLTPIYQDECVFTSGVMAGAAKWKIVVKDGKASLKELWRSKELDNHHGGVVLLDGYLYGASCVYNKEKWLCLDWKTGEKKYVDKGIGKGSLTYADGMLYILSRQSLVGLVRPIPDKHDVISFFKLPAGGKGPSWAHPVVCDGKLYIRHDDILYTYDVRKDS